MPLFFWLATFLGTLFSSVLSFLFQYLTKRLALVVTVVLAIGAVTTAFFIAIVALMSKIISVSPPYLEVAISLVVPANLPLLISISLSARLLRWAYEWNVKVIQFRLF